MEILSSISRQETLDQSLYGGKGANLARLHQSGFPVPDGYVISTKAYTSYIEQNNIHPAIAAELFRTDYQNFNSILATSKKIQDMILSGTLSEDMVLCIIDHYKQMNTPFVAVRSSATVEDGARYSFAGIFDSYLNTTGGLLIERLKKCWASLYAPRAIDYLKHSNIDPLNESMAVVVQKMVAATAAGTANSISVATRKSYLVEIDAKKGLAEEIVDGTMIPDRYTVDKKWGVVITKKYGSKPSDMSERDLKKITNLVTEIENLFEKPVDVEWAQENEKISIVQARAITGLSEALSFNYSQKISRKAQLLIGNPLLWRNHHTRGWNLLSASLFTDKLPQVLADIVDSSLTKHIYVESENKGEVTWYRNIAEHDDITAAYIDLLQNNPQKAREVIDTSIAMLSEGKRLISSQEFPFKDTETAFSFFQKMIVYLPVTTTILVDDVFPLGLGDAHFKNDVYRLRKESIHFGLMEKLLYPHIRKHIAKSGIETAFQTETLLTSSEVLNERWDLLEERAEQRRKDKKFIYFKNSDRETIFWLKDLNPILKTLPQNRFVSVDSDRKSGILKGTGLNRGYAEGFARIAIGRDPKTLINAGFKEKDIVVSENGHPDLNFFLIRSGGLISNHGGEGAHIAKIAREYDIPTVMGTGFATNWISNGDSTRIDADNGIVFFKKNHRK